MTKITLKNMMVYGFHGEFEYEREQGQRFYLDVTMNVDAPAAEKSDEVGATVDYTSVYALVRREVEQKRFLLLEALGSHLAELLLSEWITINEVTVAIRKPAVPLPGQIDYVEVEVSRRR